MEVKQYTKVLVCDRNKCPEYRGFLIMEVKQYTKVLVCDRNKCPEYRSLEVSLSWRSNNTLEY